MLCFEYTFQYDQDDVYFSYCIPYTYSKLQTITHRLLNNTENVVTERILCQSLSGLNVSLLTVTDLMDLSIPLDDRYVILVTARLHPGESNGSWMMDGFITYITSQQSSAINLRKKVIFKIIPMLNPDGVVAGNFRCSMSGKDLN